MQKQAKQRMEKSSGMTDEEGNDRNEVNRVKVNGEEGRQNMNMRMFCMQREILEIKEKGSEGWEGEMR